MRRTITRFIATILPLVALSCGPDSDPSPNAEMPRECETSRHCETGLQCQHNICIQGPKSAAMNVSVVVYPPSERSELSRITYRNVALDTATYYGNWQLQAQQSVAGRVSIGPAREDTRATIYFVSTEGIAATRYAHGTMTDNTGRFATVLPPGAYDVSIVTEREDIPEFKTHIDALPNASPLDFVLPDVTEYVRWSGRLVRIDDRATTRPLAGVRVWAVPVDNSGQSTVSVTDNEGAFAVYLPRTAREFRFQIRSTTLVGDSDEELLIPNSTFQTFTLDTEEIPPGAHMVIPGELLILDPLYPTIEIRGYVADTYGKPVANATVMATGQRTEPSGGETTAGVSVGRSTLTTRATSAKDGNFVLRIQPGLHYRFTASSMEEGVHLSAAVERYIAPTSTDVVPIALTMDAFRPQPVKINADPAFSGPIPVELSAAMRSSTTADVADYSMASGWIGSIHQRSTIDEPFDVALMAGSWRFSIRSTERLGLPAMTVTRDLPPIPLSSKEPLVFTFPPAIVIAGRVVNESGSPVAGAFVEIWQEGEEGGPQLLGSATSYGDGEVRIVLPWILKSEH